MRARRMGIPANLGVERSSATSRESHDHADARGALDEWAEQIRNSRAGGKELTRAESRSPEARRKTAKFCGSNMGPTPCQSGGATCLRVHLEPSVWSVLVPIARAQNRILDSCSRMNPSKQAGKLHGHPLRPRGRARCVASMHRSVTLTRCWSHVGRGTEPSWAI